MGYGYVYSMHWLAVEWVGKAQHLRKAIKETHFGVWCVILPGSMEAADDWFPPFIIPRWESKAEPWLQTVAALKMPQKFEVSWDFPSLVSGARNSKLLFLPLPARKNQAVRRVVSKCSEIPIEVFSFDPSLQRNIYITYIYICDVYTCMYVYI